MTEPPASPPAGRLAAPAWFGSRAVLGVLLVLASVVLGAKVVSAADRSQLVWAASRDLAPGAQLGAGDVERKRVRLFGDDTRRYLSASGPAPVGYFVRRGIGAGELLPFAALTRPGADLSFRMVTVPVARGHLPPALATGSQVDVYVTPETKPATEPRLVLRNVTVLQRPQGRGFSSAASDESVVLQVRPGDVPLLLAAMSEGRIDLVGVPRMQEAPVDTLGPG